MFDKITQYTSKLYDSISHSPRNALGVAVTISSLILPLGCYNSESSKISITSGRNTSEIEELISEGEELWVEGEGLIEEADELFEEGEQVMSEIDSLRSIYPSRFNSDLYEGDTLFHHIDSLPNGHIRTSWTVYWN